MYSLTEALKRWNNMSMNCNNVLKLTFPGRKKKPNFALKTSLFSLENGDYSSYRSVYYFLKFHSPDDQYNKLLKSAP